MKLKNIQKIKIFFSFSYVIIMVLGFFYVKNVLATVEILDYKKEKSDSFEVKPVIVKLNFNDQKTFRLKMQNTDSIGDFLDKIRDEELFFFERIKYTYGTELDYIDKQKTPVGFVWKIFLNGKDITFDIDKTNLTDDVTYDLRLIKKIN